MHGPFKTYGRYANGMVMTISGEFENGIKWIGDKGWIFVCRDGMTTPTASSTEKPAPIVPLRASDPKILDSEIGPNEFHPYTSDDQHGNWLDCIHSRKAPTAPVEIGHRACYDVPASLDCDEDEPPRPLGSGDRDDHRATTLLASLLVASSASSVRTVLTSVWRVIHEGSTGIRPGSTL